MSSIFVPEAVPVLNESIALNYHSPSDHEDCLRRCDRAWLMTLARGAQTVLAGVPVTIACVLASAMFRHSLDSLTRSILIDLGPLVMTVGSWMLTEPDPSGRGEYDYGSSRKTVRAALCVSMCMTFVQLLPEVTPVTASVRMLIGLAGMSAGVVGIVGQLANLTYLRKLALRIPHQRLANLARTLRTALSASYLAIPVVLLAIGFGVAFGGRGGMTLLAVLVGGSLVLIGLCAIAWAVAYWTLLAWLSTQLLEQAKLAEPANTATA